MDLKIIDNADHNVSMANSVARAAHGLEFVEKRLIALGISKTDSRSIELLSRAKNSGWKIRVTALEYAEIFGIEAHTAYVQIKEASDVLFHREIKFDEKGRNGKIITRRFRWVSGAVYQSGEGFVELNFTPEIAPYLLGLASNFTTMKLLHAAAFKNIYTWRLFEFLKSIESLRVYTIDIDDFLDMMEAPLSCRKDFTQTRLKIVGPSAKEICDKTEYEVEWEPIRKGSRKVVALKFTFYENPQQELALEPLLVGL